MNDNTLKIRQIGVVVTIYNAQQIIATLVEELVTQLIKMNLTYEVVFVEDGSNDASWSELEKCCVKNENLKAIRLSRNFGQHVAISAGLNSVDAEYVVLMDGDLQENPSNIGILYDRILHTDADIVYARRNSRQDRVTKILASKIFYKIFTMISGIQTDSSIGTFRIMNRKVLLAFREFRERNKYIGGIFHWMGFKSDTVETKHGKRIEGRSNYNLKRLLKLANLGIISFSNKPLNFSIYIGYITATLSLIGALYFAYRKIFLGINVSGYTSIIVSLYFLGGILLLVLGIIGKYIGQIYEQVKSRPEYLVQDKINIE